MSLDKNLLMIAARTANTRAEREENDFYATDPVVISALFEVAEFDRLIWEPACGHGHLSKEMERLGKTVFSTDLVYRGYGAKQPLNFLEETATWPGDIITNPPFNLAREFIEKGLELVEDGHKVAMFLKLQFAEGVSRRSFFEKTPPKTIYASSKRIQTARGGDFEQYGKGSTSAYAWFVWEKGWCGDTIFKWFN